MVVVCVVVGVVERPLVGLLVCVAVGVAEESLVGRLVGLIVGVVEGGSVGLMVGLGLVGVVITAAMISWQHDMSKV